MSTTAEIVAAIERAIPGARATVVPGSGGGHFEITVRARAFEGKKLLEKQRLVLGAIKHLMAGDAAPVHAVDKITTLVD